MSVERQPARRRRRREAVTGYYARRAVVEAIGIGLGLQVDLIGIALQAGRGDELRVEDAVGKVMLELQRQHELLRALLSGQFDGLGLEDDGD